MNVNNSSSLFFNRSSAASSQYLNENFSEGIAVADAYTPSTTDQVGAFKLTQKELASAKVLESVPNTPKRRGRKPSKIQR
jgi:hypothetical protein